ncbi:aspartate-semialdehyde dehydrogenase [Pseudomonas aeruginosa]|uniref:aspartate-semialdehyde dehydrogenase n=1 Tax=Pseudomonas TaxID=286 RepID=UPI0003B21CA3|nr:aspartate-semialdehyde dehydrogenase [Pseudomonas aeruginosa]AID85724.1 aspartate-semialdehyde dehydrogenase [Pseudomonas aeruginosa VRFPA04]AUA70276.1 aspartate-semialdehyde dehydrogenase [Pseudomonas aeruginosa]AUA94837.1 aspartate-semialdehyde dehydrogenase [Pseudomonas aeruginosa]EIU2891880.1 aspartate-semialdehyde dehydrogenase [Pseudomonas aeruginosa]EIU2919260.1 aspartate-semialdehyde dehydrogenase [Pseudomonas aeruginosa]
MSQPLNVAVVGATGSVGEALVGLLDERDFPLHRLHLLASAESAGQRMGFAESSLRVGDVDSFDFSSVGLAFFAAAAEVSRAHAERARAAGCSVIDLSGALEPSVAPPVMVSVNAERLASQAAPFLLSSPCAVAAELCEVLAPLLATLDCRQLNLTACLSVSSLGREGVKELARQTAELLNARPLEPRLFDRQIAFNLLAQVGAVDGEGHSAIERRIFAEVQALLGERIGPLNVTCIQAPVFFGDSLSVTLQCAEPVDLAAVTRVLEATKGIEWVGEGDYPTVVGDALGQDETYVGRVRAGQADPCQVNLWIVSDNVRKGAALNAVLLGELLIKHYL